DPNQHANRPHTPLCHARPRPKNSLDRSQVQGVMGRINNVDASGDGRKPGLLVPNEPLTLAGEEAFGFAEVLGGSAGWLSPDTLAIVPGNLFLNESKKTWRQLRKRPLARRWSSTLSSSAPDRPALQPRSG